MFKKILLVVLMSFTSIQASAQITQEFLDSLQEMTTPDLAARAENAQVKAFEMFNSLNDDDFFDVLCERVRDTGSRLSVMRCEPRFEGEISMIFNSNPLAATTGEETRADGGGYDASQDQFLADIGSEYGMDISSLDMSEWDKSQGSLVAIAYQELTERINKLRQENPEFHELYTEYQAYSVVLSKR